jgi:hypothetical protein
MQRKMIITRCKENQKLLHEGSPSSYYSTRHTSALGTSFLSLYLL